MSSALLTGLALAACGNVPVPFYALAIAGHPAVASFLAHPNVNHADKVGCITRDLSSDPPNPEFIEALPERTAVML